MEINNVCKMIDELNYEDDKDNFIKKYEEIKNNINKIDEELLNDNKDIDNLTFQEINILIENININKNIDVKKLNYYNKIIKKYDELVKNEELQFKNV
jgi:hypothetical protein